MPQKGNSKFFVTLAVIFSCISAIRAEPGKNISMENHVKLFPL